MLELLLQLKGGWFVLGRRTIMQSCIQKLVHPVRQADCEGGVHAEVHTEGHTGVRNGAHSGVHVDISRRVNKQQYVGQSVQ